MLPLLGPEGVDIDEEDRIGLSPILLNALAIGGVELTREPEAAVRRLLVQALQLLTSTRKPARSSTIALRPLGKSNASYDFS